MCKPHWISSDRAKKREREREREKEREREGKGEREQKEREGTRKENDDARERAKVRARERETRTEKARFLTWEIPDSSQDLDCRADHVGVPPPTNGRLISVLCTVSAGHLDKKTNSPCASSTSIAVAVSVPERKLFWAQLVPAILTNRKTNSPRASSMSIAVAVPVPVRELFWAPNEAIGGGPVGENFQKSARYSIHHIKRLWN